MTSERLAAAVLLGCRADAPPAEVRAAYRRALKRDRPDLGAVDGTWTVQVQRARDVLLAADCPDRRRRARRPAGPPGLYEPLRKAAWGLAEEPASSVDVRL